jgi:hypothetical protein
MSSFGIITPPLDPAAGNEILKVIQGDIVRDEFWLYVWSAA